MALSKTIADFTVELEAARAELANVNTKIETLETERGRIVAAQPHADDIAAVFLRGLNSTSADFTRQLTSRLNDTYVGDGSAGAAAPQRSFNLLTLEGHKPDREELLTRSMRRQEPDLNLAALTYFLRDQIAAEIPALVDKLCPAARQGMKQADRNSALRDIDAQLAALIEERDRLHADLGAARAAVIRS